MINAGASIFHRKLLGLARFALKHPGRYWSVVVGLASVVALIAVIATITSASSSSEQSGLIPESVVARNDPGLRDLLDATSAERGRIGELGFVLIPPPHSMPMEVGSIPGAPKNAAFDRLLWKMRDIGCADEDRQVNVRKVDSEEAADLAVQIEQSVNSGVPLLRATYLRALLELCTADPDKRESFRAAERSFGRLAEQAKEVGGPVADQFGYVAIAGQRLALVQLGEARRGAIPALPEIPPGLGAAGPCRAAQDASDCYVLQWPARRSDLSLVHEFLAKAEPDPQQFAAAISNGYDGGANLTSYNFFSFVAAHAKAGEWALVRERARRAIGLHRDYWAKDEESACKYLNRILVLAWLAGSDDRQPDCGTGIMTDLSPDDREKVNAWSSIRDLRQALLAGDLVKADMPSDDPFVTSVKNELFSRLAGFLRTRRGEAEARGDTAMAETIDGLLHAEQFSLLDRLIAGLSWKTLIWPAVMILILVAGWWLRPRLVAYGLAFTSRHHAESGAA